MLCLNSYRVPLTRGRDATAALLDGSCVSAAPPASRQPGHYGRFLASVLAPDGNPIAGTRICIKDTKVHHRPILGGFKP